MKRENGKKKKSTLGNVKGSGDELERSGLAPQPTTPAPTQHHTTKQAHKQWSLDWMEELEREDECGGGAAAFAFR